MQAKITVADCLKLTALREAELVGGANGLDRAVTSVSVLEWPEVSALSEDVLIGNEVIISALVQIKDDAEKQCRLIRHLCSMGTACLIVYYVGVFVPEIDPRLIRTADELRYPLIVMPRGRMDFRYSDAITDIVEYIHAERMQGNYYITDTMNSIALLEPHQRTMNGVLRLLSDRLRCTLILTDRYLERRAAAAWPASQQWDYAEILQVLRMQSTPPEEAIRGDFSGRSVQIWDIPVAARGHREMHLFALDESGHLTAGLLRQAAEVAALALNIWNEGAYYEGTDALISAVLNDDSAAMRRHASRMGISIEAVHTMWVFRAFRDGDEAELSDRERVDLILKIKLFLQDYHKLVIVDSYDSHIVALTDDAIFETDAKATGTEFIEELRRENCQAWACVFENLENTAQARETYIRFTKNQATLRTVFAHQKLFRESDIRFVQRCLEIIVQGERRVSDCLAPILRLKSASDGVSLLETLCTYLLDAEASSQKTGAILYLHKNTVNYRLNKIKSILRCNLTEMPETLEIYQAAAVYRILEAQ